MNNYYQVIDANINRISEGLRVIEDYTRFISKNSIHTQQLVKIRRLVNKSEKNEIKNLLIRNTKKDMRAKEAPMKRVSLKSLLKANFKRAEEGLRVLEEYTGESLYNELRYDLYLLEKEIVLASLKKPIKRGLYLISDNVEILKKGIEEGVSIIQLRDKVCPKEEFYKKSVILKKITKTKEIPFIVNDYLDIALLVDADGFHSGQDDISVKLQRELLGQHKIIGKTTHNIDQGLAAEKDGADYVSVGPIWETPSKPGRKGIGLEYLVNAQKKLKIPYVAIGGINLSRLKEVIPYQPLLVGIVRAYTEITKMQHRYFQ